MSEGRHLIRGFTDNAPEVIANVGNGAVEGGWGPVKNGLSIHFSGIPTDVGLLRKNYDKLEAYLAVFSYKARLARLKLILSMKKNPADWERLVTNEIPEVDSFLRTRDSLASSFGGALDKKQIKLRNIPKELENCSHFITTNWDSLLWDEFPDKNIIQFNGSYRESDTMVFPTETHIDDIAAHQWIQSLFSSGVVKPTDNKEAAEKIGKIFRYGGAAAELGAAYDLATAWLKSAKKIVIWGQGFNTYDVHLISWFTTHISEKKVAELVIIDPSNDSCERIKVFAGVPLSRIKCPLLS